MILYAARNVDGSIVIHAERPVFNEKLEMFISSFGEICLPKIKQRELLKSLSFDEESNIVQFRIGSMEILND